MTEYKRDYYEKNRERILAYHRERYAANKEKKREYDQKRRKRKSAELRAYDKARYHARRNTSAETQLKTIRQRARRLGIECTITIHDLPVIPKICPVLGVPIQRNKGKGGWENSPSIDRINSSLGYVPGNIAFISNRANRLKCGITLEQAKNLVAYMEQST